MDNSLSLKNSDNKNFSSEQTMKQNRFRGIQSKVRQKRKQENIIYSKDELDIEKPKKKIETPNQQTINEYKSFVKIYPELLPQTHVFKTISTIYKNTILNNPKMPTQSDYTKYKEYKENDKNNFLNKFFSNTDSLNSYLQQEPNSETFETVLYSYPNTNFFLFLTKELWYSDIKIFKSNGDLDIKQLKYQIFKDIFRTTKITINNTVLNRTEFIPFVNDKKFYEGTDYINLKIMNLIDIENIPIDLNIINLIDILLIQQIVQQTTDSVLNSLATKGIFQGGEAGEEGKILEYNIVLNKHEKYIQFHNKTSLLTMSMNPTYGSFESWFKINLNDLQYSFRFNIILPPEQTQEERTEEEQTQQVTQSPLQKYTNNISNIGKNVIDYAKNHPDSVAAGIGATSVLGSGIGALLLGVLGGKSQKRLNKIRNKKTHKNKNYRLKKYNQSKNKNKNKNKKYKTNKYRNL